MRTARRASRIREQEPLFFRSLSRYRTGETSIPSADNRRESISPIVIGRCDARQGLRPGRRCRSIVAGRPRRRQVRYRGGSQNRLRPERPVHLITTHRSARRIDRACRRQGDVVGVPSSSRPGALRRRRPRTPHAASARTDGATGAGRKRGTEAAGGMGPSRSASTRWTIARAREGDVAQRRRERRGELRRRNPREAVARPSRGRGRRRRPGTRRLR